MKQGALGIAHYFSPSAKTAVWYCRVPEKYTDDGYVAKLLLTNPDSGLRAIGVEEVESETHRKLLEASTRVRVIVKADFPAGCYIRMGRGPISKVGDALGDRYSSDDEDDPSWSGNVYTEEECTASFFGCGGNTYLEDGFTCYKV